MKIALKLVVIGHKDHGKSTLIGRLLYDGGFIKPDRAAEVEKISLKYGGQSFNYAFLLDAFEEERRDGLTIDTVNVPFETPRYRYTVVDCPGHRELMKNMMTGAADSDAALVVISAKDDERVQEQTIDHIRLTRMLGIKTLLVAVTKMDTAGYASERFNEVMHTAKQILDEAGFDAADVPFVPVSATGASNLFHPSIHMPWYTGACLSDALDATVRPPEPLTGKPLRLSVQDIYHVNGAPLVIGRIETGALDIGEQVCFQPSGAQGTVTAITVGDRDCRRAIAGASVGLRLAGIATGALHRGEAGGPTGIPPHSAKAFGAHLAVFRETPLEDGRAVVLHCTAASVPARLTEIRGTHPLVTARIVLDASIACELFADCAPLGRFIVSEGRMTIAAGIITGMGPEMRQGIPEK